MINAVELFNKDLAMLGEFRETFLSPISKFFDEDRFLELVTFRESLYKEEYDEFVEAKKNKDVAEMYDAICDMRYILVGTMDIYMAYHSLHKEQIRKIQLDSLNLNSHIVSQSNNHLTLENISKTLIITGDKVDNTPLLYFARYVDFLKMVDYAMCNERFYSAALFNENFEEVHRSNMSKICQNVREAQATVKSYAGKGVDVYFTEVEHDKSKYIIKRYGDGKVLKNINWSPPVIKTR